MPNRRIWWERFLTWSSIMVRSPPGEKVVLGGSPGKGRSEIVDPGASTEAVFLCSLLWVLKNGVAAGFQARAHSSSSSTCPQPGRRADGTDSSGSETELAAYWCKWSVSD